MALHLYIERLKAGTWEIGYSGIEPCWHLKSRTKVQPGCPFCKGTDKVTAPYYRQQTHAKSLFQLLVRLRSGMPENLSPELVALAPVSLNIGWCMLRDIWQEPWETMTVPVESFVYPHEWLIHQAQGQPPEVRFQLPAQGHTVIPEEEMPRIIHEVGDFNPNTRYVSRVTWKRAVSQHLADFVSVGVPKLRVQSDPDTVRAVFWLS